MVFPVPELWVPRPCAFCKGGYDAADTMGWSCPAVCIAPTALTICTLSLPPRAFWQARFYDFNVWTTKKRVEKLRYMHRNPVRRGLVVSPEQWRWSSYRFYLLDEAGPVRVNSGWTEISFRDRVA